MDKIICIGKNYADHARELGDAIPKQPILFMKPPSALYQSGAPLKLPGGDLHFELEIVFQIDLHIDAHFSAFTLGLDFTRRDLQKELKKNGHPWEIAKVFANAALVAPWRPMTDWPIAKQQRFELFQNGLKRQSGRAQEMIFSPAQCFEAAKEYFPLRSGDLLFTGTPSGVGPAKPGDQLKFVWGDWSHEVPPISGAPKTPPP